MTEVTAISKQATALLIHYDFELGGDTAEKLVEKWVRFYPAFWLRLAIVESLYQGRYKAISVEHILNFWQRRGEPLFHFSPEFARLICSNFYPDNTVENTIKNNDNLSKFMTQKNDKINTGLNKSEVSGEIEELISASKPSIFSIKYTDFYSKLQSVIQISQKGSDEDTKEDQ